MWCWVKGSGPESSARPTAGPSRTHGFPLASGEPVYLSISQLRCHPGSWRRRADICTMSKTTGLLRECHVCPCPSLYLTPSDKNWIWNNLLMTTAKNVMSHVKMFPIETDKWFVTGTARDVIPLVVHWIGMIISLWTVTSVGLSYKCS